jgi:hypothetical protein
MDDDRKIKIAEKMFFIIVSKINRYENKIDIVSPPGRIDHINPDDRGM